MYFGAQVPVVDIYLYLGVLLDVGLCFAPHLNAMIGRGWAAFNSLLGAAYSHSLPMPLQASAIPSRVEQAALFGIEFCIGLCNAESRLNRMQAGWAKAILGIRDCPQGHFSRS